MNFDVTVQEGEFLIQTARKAIDQYVRLGVKIKTPTNMPQKLLQKAGVFVTLNTLSDGSHHLRGCIGYPEPIFPLIDGTIESAISAAVKDPRFNPLQEEEISQIIIEVSILTPPELISNQETSNYEKFIRVGQDGLIIERGWNKGLLLPQVPIEWGWDIEEFLAQSCFKAGLPPDMWMVEGTKIYRFQAIVFQETEPNGIVVRRKLMEK
jgi:uncharacterized protein (TIGR00296 family)